MRCRPIPRTAVLRRVPLSVVLAVLALAACAQRPPPADRPYWRVEPRNLEDAPRLPSPSDAFRA